jgi:GDP/UDP-N,N'-diacetylbacillosamine 2-epimerase (hydrolysing)
MNKKIKVAIFTTTRAEFGILSPLISKMMQDKDFEPLLFVGGTHLATRHGNTIKEIIDEGFKISGIFDYLLNDDTSFSLGKSVGIAVIELAHIFKDYEFDFVCIVGDRFELLSVIINAILFKKAIIHIGGGETTEGAIDDQIRHMITKSAHLHFASCEEYARNIRKMGEQDWRVFKTGALGIENIINNPKIPKDTLFKELNLNIEKPLVIMTYHSVTLEFDISPEKQIENVFSALKDYDVQLVVTSTNIDVDHGKIFNVIQKKIEQNLNYVFVYSLGMRKYLGLISYSEFVIGNSSSGIIEVPYFRIPTVNIGDRQNGRIRHASVIDTGYSVDSIKSGIDKALSKEFKASIKDMELKFGDGYTAKRMLDIIRKTKITQDFMRKKGFSN